MKPGGEPKEPVSSKPGRTSETVVTFQIHSHKARIVNMSAGPPENPQQLNPDSPYPIIIIT